MPHHHARLPQAGHHPPFPDDDAPLRELHKALSDNAHDRAAAVAQQILETQTNYPESVVEYAQSLVPEIRPSAPPAAFT